MNTKLFLTTFFLILFSLGIGFVFTTPTRAQEPAVETTTLSLTAHHIHGFLLTPTNPTMTQTIPIDAATDVSFHLGSTSQDLSITLIGPSDQRVNLGDAATSLAQNHIISDPTTIGVRRWLC